MNTLLELVVYILLFTHVHNESNELHMYIRKNCYSFVIQHMCM